MFFSVGSASKGGSVTTSSYGIAVGNQPSGAGGDKPWDGLLDDVRIYDRPLSQSDVNDLANM